MKIKKTVERVKEIMDTLSQKSNRDEYNILLKDGSIISITNDLSDLFYIYDDFKTLVLEFEKYDKSNYLDSDTHLFDIMYYEDFVPAESHKDYLVEFIEFETEEIAGLLMLNI